MFNKAREENMAEKWFKTQFPGVRYRESTTKKHSGKPDRNFTIRYKLNGVLKEEGLGWASDGWNAQKASLTRSELIITPAIKHLNIYAA
jgi:hypothetical protein